MRGEKTITLEFPVNYSSKGAFLESDKITLRAPGFAKFDVHSTMTAYVGEAMKGFITIREQMTAAQAAAEAGDEDENEKPDDEDRDVMQLMAMGLGIEKYPAFALYLKKILTNAPKLATIGEQNDPISDEVWMEIENAGGVDGANRIFSEFTGFFFDSLGKKLDKKSGRSSATSSATPPKAISPTKPRANSRSQS